MEKKYTLIITEKQAVLIKDALEEYFRIRMNQWGDLADSLVMKDIDLSPHNPKYELIFEKDTECDKCELLSDCKENGCVFNVSTSMDSREHFVPGLRLSCKKIMGGQTK